MLEQVETVDKLFVGGVENLSDEAFLKKLDESYQMGIRLVEEIEKVQRED